MLIAILLIIGIGIAWLGAVALELLFIGLAFGFVLFVARGFLRVLTS